MNTGKLSTQFLQQDSQALGPLADKLGQIRYWQNLLAQNILPEDSQILRHCHVIHADKTSLTIIVDSPHWATRLRFLTPKLIARLQKEAGLSGLETIRHKIAPTVLGRMGSERVKKLKMPLSKKNSDLMRETANSIRHQGLQAVLKKMAGKAP